MFVLDNKAGGLLHDGAGCLQRWAPLFPDFAEIIKRKLNMPQYNGLAFETCQLIGFLDCKFDETCAPGSGPMMNEELADRWEKADLIQEAEYSGYVKAHGSKVLTVLFPNGITGYLYGPISGCENDIAILNTSWLNHQFLLLQEDITAALACGKAAVHLASFHTISALLINMSLPWGECCMRGWKQRTWQQTVSVRPSNGRTVTLLFCFISCMKHIQRRTSYLNV